MVTHSIGEPIITTLIKPSLVITQGFLQPEDNFVGIDPTWEKALIRIFPNPTSQEIFIEGEIRGHETFTIFDMQGREVLKTILKDQRSISVTNLSAGVYQVLILDSQNQRWLNVKLIKQ
ncbi:MAG: T9SS type A sorting domain-containing protein [Bacteroidetes bacterium]|nr:T9SS type A sorting domain-containing protein [Bacteroidota bacterium]MCB0842297.1 T9SS type A sorting domain-containing protein [Bacteroidota bacterium]